MNRYQFVLYVGFALSILCLFKEKRNLYQFSSMIAIVGGIIFSIIFETKGRYVMTYVILMQTYSAVGLGKSIIWLEGKIVEKKLLFNQKEENT